MQSIAENAGLRRQARRAGEPHIGNQMQQCRRWEATETPKYVPGQKYVCWASISSIPRAWPCHTATCAPAAQPLKLAYFQGCRPRNDPLEKPSPTILALTAEHNGVAEKREGGIRSRQIKRCVYLGGEARQVPSRCHAISMKRTRDVGTAANQFVALPLLLIRWANRPGPLCY